jgi:hypothetical protein
MLFNMASRGFDHSPLPPWFMEVDIGCGVAVPSFRVRSDGKSDLNTDKIPRANASRTSMCLFTYDKILIRTLTCLSDAGSLSPHVRFTSPSSDSTT